jgi:hypothetical protein
MPGHVGPFKVFGDRIITGAERGLWTLILLGAGLGMELNFALAAARPLAPDHLSQAMRSAAITLEHARAQEVAIRRYLRTAAK